MKGQGGKRPTCWVNFDQPAGLAHLPSSFGSEPLFINGFMYELGILLKG
jgi:hypothetical protein